MREGARAVIPSRRPATGQPPRYRPVQDLRPLRGDSVIPDRSVPGRLTTHLADATGSPPTPPELGATPSPASHSASAESQRDRRHAPHRDVTRRHSLLGRGMYPAGVPTFATRGVSVQTPGTCRGKPKVHQNRSTVPHLCNRFPVAASLASLSGLQSGGSLTPQRRGVRLFEDGTVERGCGGAVGTDAPQGRPTRPRATASLCAVRRRETTNDSSVRADRPQQHVARSRTAAPTVSYAGRACLSKSQNK